MTKKSKGRLSVFAVFLILFAVLAAPAAAFSVPEKPDNNAVYDDTGLISSETREYLIVLNDMLYENCRGQTVIAMFTGIGGEDIAELAKQCFNGWGIGDSEYNRGVLFLMTAAEDDYWALQGKGLEDSLTSGEIGIILDESVEPYFAAKDYDGAAKAFAEAVYKKLASIYGFSGRLPNEPASSGKTKLTETAEEERFSRIPESVSSPISSDRERDFSGNVFSVFFGIFRAAVSIFILVIFIAVFFSCCGCGDLCRCCGCCRSDFGGGGYGGGFGGGGFGRTYYRSFPRGGSSFGGRRTTGGTSSGGAGRSFGGSRGIGGGSRGSSGRSGGFGGGSSRGGGAGRGRR
ncbi:MAG: TPM domain-containing protein [Clostridiales bacterium]|jgi:uncharacterized protein|nr:TPM domain-containing protein [Clostridiales bacterium]